ncbi:carboxylic ester hydrolase-like [Lycorma delicatula]|uniref:carboxylic ester hydrolase-like n=1 Tax=Lycorma delicatula TaxID=130591 RepID=UPI003F5184D6
MFDIHFKLNVVFLLIITILLVLFIPLSYEITIKTPQGKIKGFLKQTLNGRNIQAFLGVPYAKPPVENLRFKDPVPFGKWEDVYDGTKEPHDCIQKNVYSNFESFLVIGEEDCLYLNVYTPDSKKPKHYPVMVFIHGGGFTCGSSNLYGPEYILDKDVILVTINYRLGALGFASTEDINLPGNYGLKDQVLALKWVQENIASYGGNPDSVTIFGQSAGGASVHYHMISPLSKGLFHRGILMSGSSHCPWALAPPGTNKKRTQELAAFLGCPTEQSNLLVDCLRTASAYLMADLLTEYRRWGIDPPIPFAPVIEPVGVKNAFLTSEPHNEKTTIPVMTGFTSEDGAFRVSLFASSPIGMDKTLEILNYNFNDVSKVSVTIYEDEKVNQNEISNEIRKFYFGEKKIDKNSISEVIKMYTDAWFMQCATSVLRNHQGDANFYYFAQRGPHSSTFGLSNSTEYFGVSHGDDLMYIFPLKSMTSSRKYLTTDERKIQQEMVSLWTNFAIHGDPTPDGKWKKSSSENFDYLHIENGQFQTRNNFLPERVKFWKNLQWKSKTSQVKDEL